MDYCGLLQFYTLYNLIHACGYKLNVLKLSIMIYNSGSKNNMEEWLHHLRVAGFQVTVEASIPQNRLSVLSCIVIHASLWVKKLAYLDCTILVPWEFYSYDYSSSYTSTLRAASISYKLRKGRNNHASWRHETSSLRATMPAWYSQTDKFDVSAYQYKHANLWTTSQHNCTMSYYICPMRILRLQWRIHSTYIM